LEELSVGGVASDLPEGVLIPEVAHGSSIAEGLAVKPELGFEAEPNKSSSNCCREIGEEEVNRMEYISI
jgi:hypothetical protein